MENEWRLSLIKLKARLMRHCVVMARMVTTSVGTLKYVVPRLSRTKVVAAQYDARRSVKGVGSAGYRRSFLIR